MLMKGFICSPRTPAHSGSMTEIIYTRSELWYSPSRFIVTIVNLVFGVVEFMLAVRIVLELLGASAAAPFVAWVYIVTAGLATPFSGAFPSWDLGQGYVLDLSAIFAMIGYAIIGWIVVRLLSLLFSTLYSARV